MLKLALLVRTTSVMTLFVAIMLWGSPPAWAAPLSYRERIEQVWQIVSDNFLDPGLRGIDWAAQKRSALERLPTMHSDIDNAAVINTMLASLHTSHTHFYIPEDPLYWYLVTTFGADVPRFPRALLIHGHVQVADVGIFTRDGYISAVLDGSPAARAGLRVGDRMVDVDGQPYRGMSAWHSGQPAAVRVQHTAADAPVTLRVTPVMVEPQTALVTATRHSLRVIQQDGHRIGYIHAWAFTNEDVQPLIHDALGQDFKDCDALILDLRDGLGGGSLEFILPWLAVPHLTFMPRHGARRMYPPRPPRTIVLTNEGTRSGKEIFAYTFKHGGLGTLVGSPTAGAVSAGQPFYLSDGTLLYLAVAQVLVDGVDLEGHGVTPDVAVDRPIPYCNGADPQLEAAIHTAAVPIP